MLIETTGEERKRYITNDIMDKGTYRHGHRKQGIHEILIRSHSAGALGQW